MRQDEFEAFLKQTVPDMGYRWRRLVRRNVRRRLRRRMESLGLHDLDKYRTLVDNDPVERDVLESILRVTITRFFRNAGTWQDLEATLTEALAARSDAEPLLAWSAGCAGGEEPYSMAMMLTDMEERGSLKAPWRITATDSDLPSLARADRRTYRWGSVREIPEEIRDRWFSCEGEDWILDDRVAGKVTFRRHDLLHEGPPGRFHLVLLRNSILTYNTVPVQKKVLAAIAGCLDYPGLLVIGRKETLPEGTGFENVKKSIYRSTARARL